MSWSINVMGKPEKVAEAIEKHSEKLDGFSRQEYDAAKPHLLGLVRQTFGQGDGLLIDLEASGSGSHRDGKQHSGSCQASIKPIWKNLAL